MGIEKYCFPSTNYKNKAPAGQDMQCVLLISTSQEGSKRGRKCALKGVDWVTRLGRCFLFIRPGECSLSDAPAGRAPRVGAGRDWEALGSQCLFMWSPVWPHGPKAK